MLALSQADSARRIHLSLWALSLRGRWRMCLAIGGIFSEINESLSIVQAMPVRLAQRYGLAESESFRRLRKKILLFPIYSLPTD